ncbi:MAG: hypothetical protein CVU57_22955 [Deltaproteobacteria bacterium HGW-Deltaproteobacteria-15]|jgi:hypothetical protein|nr:MAG: hypothetical protein CVU57_22955 [Deltaproteobacteria bacterium HGW-Deltaproteobacteria-15]
MNPYDFAIQMSRDGEKFFRVLKRQVTKPGLRRILVMLAKDQALHRQDLLKMKKAEGTSLDDAGNLSGVRNPFAERIERLAAGEWLDENLPSAELHRRGKELANECEDFYRKRAAMVKSPSLKQAFLGVAEVQRKHYLTLEHLIKQGLADAEWKVAVPLECSLAIQDHWGECNPAKNKSDEHEGKVGDHLP